VVTSRRGMFIFATQRLAPSIGHGETPCRCRDRIDLTSSSVLMGFLRSAALSASGEALSQHRSELGFRSSIAKRPSS
jgi:hypothetical protein